MELISILGICLIAAVLVILLEQYKREYAAVCSVAAGVVIIVMLSGSIGTAIQKINELIAKSDGAANYFKIALKALGIAYLTSFVADVCRDFGQTSLAAKAELGGKCAVFLLALPLLDTLLSLALEFINT